MDSFIHSREKTQILFGEYFTINGNNKEYLWVSNEVTSVTSFSTSKTFENFRLWFCRNGDRCFKMALKIPLLGHGNRKHR